MRLLLEMRQSWGQKRIAEIYRRVVVLGVKRGLGERGEDFVAGFAIDELNCAELLGGCR